MTQAAEAPTDEALMSSVAHGDRRAFGLLVTRHEVAVRRFCGALLGDAQSGRDAAQETFLAVWKARERYTPRGAFKGYLFTVARRHCYSQHRRRKVARLFLREKQEAPTPVAAPHEAALEDQQSRALVRQALNQLPFKFREPLVLRFVENLEYDEIARVIGRTPSAARSRIFYGLRALERHLPPEARSWTDQTL